MAGCWLGKGTFLSENTLSLRYRMASSVIADRDGVEVKIGSTISAQWKQKVTQAFLTCVFFFCSHMR